MKLELREYQVDGLERIAAAEARGVRRQLGVAATGLGKTVLFASLAERRKARTLVLAHRDELVTQAAAKLLEVWPELGATEAVHVALRSAGLGDLSASVALNPRGVGIVKAAADDVAAQVVVASVQTLSRPARLARLTGAMADEVEALGALWGGERSEPFDLVVVDEAHHATAVSYRAVLDGLRAGHPQAGCGDECDHGTDRTTLTTCAACGGAGLPAGPLLLGVTATPDRGDGKGLDDLFDEVTFSYDLLWGIRAGYLADLRGQRVVVEALDLSGVKVRRGDYDAGAAGRALEDADAPQMIVAAWMEHALGRRTLVFTPTVATAASVAAQFAAVGVRAGMVHGGTPMDERRQVLQAYAAGDLDVLANCAVLTEGYDEPRTDCIVIARPTKSRALFTQMVGRGTRRHPDKVDCLVLDVVGASAVHSLVTVPSLFGLGGEWADQLGDGSGLLSDVCQAHDDDQVRLGKMRAEDADLFRKVRGQGIAWVAVHAEGAPLRRYVRTLGKDQDGVELPTVVLAQRDAEVWTAGLWWPATRTAPERKAVLMAEVGMELAQGMAEDYVRKMGGGALTDADAKWRTRKPSPKALEAAKRWRLTVDPAWTAGELSEALDAHVARIKAKQAAPR